MNQPALGIRQPDGGLFLITGVSGADLDALWPRLEFLASRALAGCDELAPGDLYAQALAGTMQIWAVFDTKRSAWIGFAATEVLRYPRSSALYVVAFAGQRTLQWAWSMLDTLRAFARFHKVERIEARADGRWLRALVSAGFVPGRTVAKLEV